VSGVLLRVGGIGFVILLAVWLYALLDAITSDATRVRALPKGTWVVIVLIGLDIGAILWLLFGRPKGADPGLLRGRAAGRQSRTDPESRRETWAGWPRQTPRQQARSGAAGDGRPAPDDDPEFLARLARQANDAHQELLAQWEADLKRREDELRRRGEDRTDGSEPD
jgi:Phospholipase_D-nuclease N-terminal